MPGFRPYRSWGVSDGGVAGSGQVSGLVKRNSGPCLGSLPLTPCILGGFGRRMTRSERTRPTCASAPAGRVWLSGRPTMCSIAWRSSTSAGAGPELSVMPPTLPAPLQERQKIKNKRAAHRQGGWAASSRTARVVRAGRPTSGSLKAVPRLAGRLWHRRSGRLRRPGSARGTPEGWNCDRPASASGLCAGAESGAWCPSRGSTLPRTSRRQVSAWRYPEGTGFPKAARTS